MPCFSLKPAGAAVAIMLLAVVPARADDHEMMPYDADLEAAIAPPEATDLPRDETALRALETKHRRLLRLAERQCADVAGGGSAERNPCIISTVERGVSNADDAQLAAFHAALPFQVRYDPNRRPDAWRYPLRAMPGTGDRD